MGLLEQQKAERKGRILAAARKLIAARGYHGLTMRDLARDARVSVPTLYNLFGGKDAILAAELESGFAVAAVRAAETEGGFLSRAFAVFDTATGKLEELPDYYRELVHLFLSSPEVRPIRHRIEGRYIALMADNLRRGQEEGGLAPWADPDALARLMFGHYLSAMLGWGLGELSFAGFRAAALAGTCLVLLAVARGPTADRLTELFRRLQKELPRPRDLEMKDAVTDSDSN